MMMPRMQNLLKYLLSVVWKGNPEHSFVDLRVVMGVPPESTQPSQLRKVKQVCRATDLSLGKLLGRRVSVSVSLNRFSLKVPQRLKAQA